MKAIAHLQLLLIKILFVMFRLLNLFVSCIKCIHHVLDIGPKNYQLIWLWPFWFIYQIILLSLAISTQQSTTVSLKKRTVYCHMYSWYFYSCASWKPPLSVETTAMASAVVPENKKIHQANSVSVGLCCLLLLGTDFCNFATMRFQFEIFRFATT